MCFYGFGGILLPTALTLSEASATDRFEKRDVRVKYPIDSSGTAILMHYRGNIRCNKASLLQGLVVFPGGTGGGVDADDPDKPEVIQGDLLLSSFQGHLSILSQTIPRAKEWWQGLLAPVMCGAAGGVPPALGCGADSSVWCTGRHPAEDCKGQHCLLSRHR